MSDKEEESLSEKAKENLRKNEELRQSGSKFVKIQPKEEMILKFNPEKIEQTESIFNGEKKPRIRYTVTDETGQEKYFEVSKQASKEIDSLLGQGKTKLKIKRYGLGKETRYYPEAIV